MLKFSIFLDISIKTDYNGVKDQQRLIFQEDNIMKNKNVGPFKRIFAFSMALLCIITMNATLVFAASIPTITYIKAKTSSSISIKWKKYSGATGYIIYQKKEDGKYKKLKTINNVKTTSYTSNNLDSATKYSYKIKAYTVKKLKNKKTKTTYTDASKAVSAYTKLDTTKITAIAGITSTSIKIKWKLVDDADGYQIYKKTKDGYEKVTTVKSGSKSTYTIKKLPEGKKQGFAVRAYKKVGNNKYIYGALSEVKYSFPAMPVPLNELFLIDSAYYEYKSGSFTDAFGNNYAGVHYFEQVFQSLNGREPHATYNLNADYSEFSGSIVAAPYTNMNKSYYIHIYADDVLVHSVSGYRKTTGKIDFCLDVTNIEIISICVGQETGGGDTNCDIGIVNAQLTK